MTGNNNIPAPERSKEEMGEAVVWGNARSLAEAFDGEVWGRVVSAVKSEHFDVPLYAAPAPVPVTITDADRERAAQAIYERGPSIGGDTEDGWSAQSNDYKRKAREIANVALSALSAKLEKLK